MFLVGNPDRKLAERCWLLTHLKTLFLWVDLTIAVQLSNKPYQQSLDYADCIRFRKVRPSKKGTWVCH